MNRLVLALALLLTGVAASQAGEHRFLLLGLFQPDRVEDLRQVIAAWEGVTLVQVDYDKAEARFKFEESVVFPNARKPDQVATQFNDRLRQLTRGTFEALPPSTFPEDQLQRIEIPIAGLDCKGCSFAAYLAVYRLEGVHRATASFHEGKVVAWIDPAKASRAALEAALTKKEVRIAAPALSGN